MIRSQNDIFIRTFDKIFHTEKKGIPQQNSLDPIEIIRNF